jgi:hypothetical protein
MVNALGGLASVNFIPVFSSMSRIILHRNFSKSLSEEPNLSRFDGRLGQLRAGKVISSFD